MITRVTKSAVLGVYGLVVLLAAVDNIVDPGSNFPFVAHVLAMDTVFEGSTLKWRAIESETARQIAYGLIIATELVIALLCIAGAARLLRRVRVPASFNRAKGLGLLGLGLSLGLWFFGFYALGGEWFVSWQSERWSSTEPGMRLTVLVLLLWLFVSAPDREVDA
ncbi:MAG: DUF2165 domain-containing protein [Myxococcota bacterium]